MSFNLHAPAHWKLVKLSSLGEMNRGRSRHRPRDASHLYGGPYPFIQTGDVKASNGRISRYTNTYSEAGLQQSRLWPAGTMCITIAANIAETGILQFPACFPDSVIGFIADDKKCDIYFVEYMFRLLRKRIQAQATGSVQDNINLQTLERIEFPLPDLCEQKAIAAVLCSFDNKVQLNHQINQTLEQMAQAIFKSWFVDFEPVKAKIAALKTGVSEEDALLAAMQAISGKDEAELTRLQAEQPEQYAELRATAELFPSAMQDSELGEIPEGWAAGTLSNIAHFTNDRISTDKLTLSNYVSTENMLENKAGIVDASSLPNSASVPSFEPGEVLISNIRPYFKKIWHASKPGGRSPDVLGFQTKNPGTSEFLFNLLYQDGFFEYMMLTSKGAKMPRGDKKAIMQLSVTVPPLNLMQKFSATVRAFHGTKTLNDRQSKLLGAMRNALLPKLLSGELTVSGVEATLTSESPALQQEHA